jgi:hypothetical protein
MRETDERELRTRDRVASLAGSAELTEVDVAMAARARPLDVLELPAVKFEWRGRSRRVTTRARDAGVLAGEKVG